MLKFGYVVAAGLVLGGLWTAPAEAVTVDYNLTFTGMDNSKANGSGVLVIDETLPLNNFTENFLGDFVSLTVNINGISTPFSFGSSNLTVDLGTNQNFYSLTGSSPTVSGPDGMETLVLGGSGFNITNPGGPNYDDGRFTIGTGTIVPSATPLPPTWTMLLAGLVGLGLFVYRGSKTGSAGIAAV
jgi:hypothetical protein